MSYDLVSDIRAELLCRPKYSALFENLISNKFGVLSLRCINMAQIKYYETKRLTSPNFEKTATITLPAGTAFSVNAKKYILNSGSTPILTADILRLKKLWVLGDSAAKTDTSSTFDTDSAEGSGIPDDKTVIGVSDVYHEMVGEGSTQSLEIVIGTTAAGSAPKVEFTYTPTLTLATGDSDSVKMPYNDFLGTFMPLVNGYLKQYIGFDGY